MYLMSSCDWVRGGYAQVLHLVVVEHLLDGVREAAVDVLDAFDDVAEVFLGLHLVRVVLLLPLFVPGVVVLELGLDFGFWGARATLELVGAAGEFGVFAEVVGVEEVLLFFHFFGDEGVDVVVFNGDFELVEVRSGLVASLLDLGFCGVMVAVWAEVVDGAVDRGVLLAPVFVLLVAADEQLVGFALGERGVRLR